MQQKRWGDEVQLGSQHWLRAGGCTASKYSHTVFTHSWQDGQADGSGPRHPSGGSVLNITCTACLKLHCSYNYSDSPRTDAKLHLGVQGLQFRVQGSTTSTPMPCRHL